MQRGAHSLSVWGWEPGNDVQHSASEIQKEKKNVFKSWEITEGRVKSLQMEKGVKNVLTYLSSYEKGEV